MKMKVWGKYFLIVGVLMWLLLFWTGSAVNEEKEKYRNQGIFESLWNEFTGKNAETVHVINTLGAFNAFLMGGGAICMILGVSALIVAKWEKHANRSATTE